MFGQLGLDNTPEAMDHFIVLHRGLAAGAEIWSAPFWSASQARFLREGLHRDADWAVVIDSLSLRLSQ